VETEFEMPFSIRNGSEVVAAGATELEALEAMGAALSDIDGNIKSAEEYDNADGWFSLHFDVGGEEQDEAAFFAALAFDDELEFVMEEQIILRLAAFNKDAGTVYTHEELETGSAAAEYYASQDADLVWVYHEFLKSLDLDHTVEQIDVVERLIALHGRDEMDSIIGWLDRNGGVLFEHVVEEPADHGHFPLHDAIYADDVDAVKAALAENPALDERDNLNSNIPLHCLSGAVTPATLEILDLLLEAGADVDARDSDGETLLHRRVGRADWLELTMKLIDAGADPSARSENELEGWTHGFSRTPIFGAFVPEQLQLLLDCGASVQLADPTGQTPLHNLVIWAHDDETIKIALANGADPNAADQGGWTPLHRAAKSHKKSFIRLLLAAGGDQDVKNERGDTPYDLGRFSWPKDVPAAPPQPAPPAVAIHEAARENDVETVRAHVEAGTDVDFRDDQGNTALIAAAPSADSSDAMRALLEAGAAVNAIDSDGRTAAFRIWGIDQLEVLVEFGADLNIQDVNGKTMLHDLAWQPAGRTELIHAACAHGADPNVQDSKGRSPVFYAAMSNSAANAKALVDAGGDPELADNEGETPEGRSPYIF
jgi:cytohesin